MNIPINQLREVFQALLASSQNTDFAGTALSLRSCDSVFLCWWLDKSISPYLSDQHLKAEIKISCRICGLSLQRVQEEMMGKENYTRRNDGERKLICWEERFALQIREHQQEEFVGRDCSPAAFTRCSERGGWLMQWQQVCNKHSGLSSVRGPSNSKEYCSWFLTADNVKNYLVFQGIKDHMIEKEEAWK